ncbi:MAG TPA: nitrilase-related carbon-nitrogen hydrolase [Acidobacteriaceae bacterium]|jgi:apolipoprotein N-acyltransferase|nr:nitrilase-related carbon-nitrogen hydrolase [Acidobacteriaceae bacterium]
MEFKVNAVHRVGAIVLSAVALWFGTGLHPLWWLLWIAPIPVLVVAARSTRLTAFTIAIVAWTIGALNAMRYYRIVELPWIVILEVVLGPAIVFACAVLLWRRLLLRGAFAFATIAFPTVWVSYEFILSLLSPHSTWGNLAYTQMDCLPILQLASITGVWGISFLVFLFAATVAGATVAVLSSAGTGIISKRQLRSVAASVSALLLVIVAWGTWRLHSMPASPQVTVGLIASDIPQNLSPRTAAGQSALFDKYGSVASGLVSQGAQVIVDPEKTAMVPLANIHEMDAPLEAATDGKAIVVQGVLGLTANTKLNQARIYAPNGTAPNGTLEATYEKHHMLPAFEWDELPGTTRTLLHEPSGIWGVAICKDMDFPKLSRQYGNDGVGLQLVPAWDFVSDGWLHDRMAIMRGVESGFSIARTAKQGLLTVSDDRGRVLAQRTTGSAPWATLLATVPVHHDATLYARWGNWFAVLCVAALIALLVLSFLKRSKPVGS